MEACRYRSGSPNFRFASEKITNETSMVLAEGDRRAGVVQGGPGPQVSPTGRKLPRRSAGPGFLFDGLGSWETNVCATQHRPEIRMSQWARECSVLRDDKDREFWGECLPSVDGTGMTLGCTEARPQIGRRDTPRGLFHSHAIPLLLSAGGGGGCVHPGRATFPRGMSAPRFEVTFTWEPRARPCSVPIAPSS